MLNFILDLIYPPRCILCNSIIYKDNSKWVCKFCVPIFIITPTRFSIKLEQKDNNYKQIINYSICEYDDIIKELIHRFKYQNHPQYAKGILSYIKDEIDLEFFKGIDYLVPIPMHKQKEKARGFNQAYLLAKELSKVTKIPIAENLILRIKNTTPQSSLSARSRLNNLLGAFAVNNNSQSEICNKNIVLIDDIYTTGSTVSAVAQVLFDSGCRSVSSFTFAFTKKNPKNTSNDISHN